MKSANVRIRSRHTAPCRSASSPPTRSRYTAPTRAWRAPHAGDAVCVDDRPGGEAARGRPPATVGAP